MTEKLTDEELKEFQDEEERNLLLILKSKEEECSKDKLPEQVEEIEVQANYKRRTR